MMLKKEGAFLTGNSRFEGYLADIIAKLAEVMNLRYEIRITRDGQYGKPEGANMTWNGMLGEVIRQEADMAAGPLTISEQRKLVVDFSKPFMTFRSTALIKKPKRRRNRLKTAKDLLESPYTYGVVQGSITQELFSLTGNATYQRMWARMNTFWPPAFAANVQEGLERARREKYAFILDTPIAEYVSSRRPCDLYSIEPFLDRRQYAFAVRRGDPRMDGINAALESFHSTQDMQSMYLKWWSGECHKHNQHRNEGGNDDSSQRPRGARNGKSRVTTEPNPWRYATVKIEHFSSGSSSVSIHSFVSVFVILYSLVIIVC